MLPATEPELDEFIASFEDGTLPKCRWTHGAHLLTGACYVHTFGVEAAADRMRVGVKRYNLAVGGKNTETSGYHETITVAWVKILDRLLREAQAERGMSRAEFAALAVARYEGDHSHPQRYYDFDLVASTEARRVWVAPTLASFD